MSRSLLNRLDRLTSNVSGAISASSSEQQISSNQSNASQYYAIRVVDSVSRHGIPLVYLRTTFSAIYVTDSAGYIAFNEPDLMNGDPMWVTVASYGYESPTGFLGVSGMQINPKSGDSIEINLNRTQIAERLYRMTGYGIYRDSALMGKTLSPRSHQLNAQVTGSDTIQCAEFQGKLLWMWQDTNRLSFELGNFNMTGATTDLPEKLNPDSGLKFDYYTVDGKPNEFARPMAYVPLKTAGHFPLWVDGLTVVPDREGNERMVGTYCATGQEFACIERGLVVWNDTKQILERLIMFNGTDTARSVLAPLGHTIYVRDGGTRYAYYGSNIRVKANFEDAKHPAQYEAFTCLKSDDKTANRSSNGTLIWGWVKGGQPVNYETSEGLVNSGTIRADEAPYQLKDIDSGQTVVAHYVGIAWNPYLNLYINIFQQYGGDTVAGEIWISTARSPEGPWVACRKVATHGMAGKDVIQGNNNDLYNPVQHFELMREGGRYVYFSGTLVNTFSGNLWPTPYYDYNNIMYRLDLADPRLKLPTPPPGLWGTVPDV